MPKRFDDSLTEHGAQALCAHIRRYWEARGRHEVAVWPEVEVREPGRAKSMPASLHVVRSNIRFVCPS